MDTDTLLPGTQWVVSYWHIPGGGDFTNAKLKRAEFATIEYARSFAASLLPEQFPLLMSIAAFKALHTTYEKE